VFRGICFLPNSLGGRLTRADADSFAPSGGSKKRMEVANGFYSQGAALGWNPATLRASSSPRPFSFAFIRGSNLAASPPIDVH
jgi:hypothetical protein